MDLKDYVSDHIMIGCLDVSKSLGMQYMPDGYALMINPDYTHFYWINSNGKESGLCWDKWQVYLGAKVHSKKGNEP